MHGLNSIAASEVNYSKYLSPKAVLNGAKFGLPRKRCWNLVPDDLRRVATEIFEAIREVGGEIIDTDFPCAEERLSADGTWDW